MSPHAPAPSPRSSRVYTRAVRQRLLLGPVLIALLLGLMWLDGLVDRATLPESWRGLFAGRETPPPGTVLFVVAVALALLAARELAAMLKANGIEGSRRVMSAAAIIGLCVSCLVPAEVGGATGSMISHSAAVVVFMGALLFYSRKSTFEGVLAASAGALLAYVYLGLMLGFVLAIRREHDVWVLLWVLATTKACDIGAFFTGTAIGRHKLIPWLSKGKTWEGLAGGVLFSMLVGAAGAALIRDHLPLPDPWIAGAFAGALFGMVGQIGDLIESLLKRDSDLKDAGSTLPGFGGVLDVLDSPLLVAPVAFWWLRWFTET